MMAKVLAGIVLYNSDFPRLLECLAGLENQVESIIVWDNSPQEYSALEREKICEYRNCEYIYANENLGMPEGMNRIMQIAKNRGLEWVLTMNADSIVPDNLIENMLIILNNQMSE